ncbi:MAG: glutathione S-transferase C-terminal domain-containing protein [Rhodobacterales bacterium]|nr:glutathione S-transferase C-terminal domain-containing protein [Rhodobacterales bacterium]
MARHTVAEQLVRVDKDLIAITDILGDKPFLFGDKPSAADASVVAILTNIATAPVATPLSKRLNNDVNLTAYRNRGCAALFPAP